MISAERLNRVKTFITMVTFKDANASEHRTFEVPFVVYAYTKEDAENYVKRDLYSDKYNSTKYDPANIIRYSDVKRISKSEFDKLKDAL